VRERFASGGRGGFTLLEIMVALSILLMVVAAIYASWIAVVRGTETGRKAAAAAQRSRVAARALEDALTTARMFAADSYDYSFIAENGDDATLSFVAKPPEMFPRGTATSFKLRRVTFSVERDKDSSQNDLVLRQRPVLLEMDKHEEEDPVVLAHNVKKFEMQFWDVRKGMYVDEWPQTNQLPTLVMIVLEIGADEAHSQLPQSVVKEIGIPTTTVPYIWQTTVGPPPGPPKRQ
jgi:type II secretion system protein J